VTEPPVITTGPVVELVTGDVIICPASRERERVEKLIVWPNGYVEVKVMYDGRPHQHTYHVGDQIRMAQRTSDT
jgi:hypothetical protein